MIAFHHISNSLGRSSWQPVAATLLIVAFGVGIASSAAAVGLVYVDADDGFSSSNPNLSPLSAIDSLQSIRDNRWGFRSLGALGTVFEAGINANPGDEDAPELTFSLDTADGLVSGNSYDLYVMYWSATGQNWSIKAGLTSGNHTLFNRVPVGFLPTAVSGTPATSALWTTPPPLMTEGDRIMLMGKVGTATATGGQINVFIDDLPTNGFAESLGGNSFNYRTWLDGVAFVEAGSAISLNATVNRTTGQISLSNDTGQSVPVVSYSVNSAAGALNPNSWLSISANYDGNDGSEFDTDLWNITAPTMPFPAAATTLSEAEDASGGNSGGALTAGGLNLGNAWIRTPIEDVQISLTLANASVITITPQYTGNAIAPGDLDADNDIDLVDFDTLRTNMHTNVAALTRAQTYRLGDMTGNLAINFDDFVAFRTAYNSAHGAGAFELAVGVPEPATIFLFALGLLGVIGRGRTHSRTRWATAPMPATNAGNCHRTLSANQQRQQHSDRHRGDNMSAWERIASRALALALTCGIVALDGRSAYAQLTYVDANATVGSGNTGPASAFAATNADDNLWGPRSGFASSGTIYQSGDGNGEDSPEISTVISGLTPNALYSVYAHFWDGSGTAPDWNVRAGFTSGNTTLFANPADAADIGAQNGVLASTLSYATAPTVFVEADRTMYAGLIGPTKANGSGEITVFVDDLPSTIGVNNRTWYDGLSYEVASLLTLRVNTTTGAVSILNSTGTNFDTNYYEIRSATGALNLAGWNSFDDQEGADPVGTGWDETGGSGANILSEVNLAGMKSFGTSSSATLGTAFSVGGAPDITFAYSLMDTTLRLGYVEYVTGPTPVAGDYNGNGTVDAADYVVWRNSVGPGSLPNEGGVSPGVVDQADYNFWKSRFGMTSGAGSVVAGTSVPEPSVAMLVVPVLALLGVKRRRRVN